LATKGKQRILPKGGGLFGFFGWHLVHNVYDKIIITGLPLYINIYILYNLFFI
jgi:hypothetical protein